MYDQEYPQHLNRGLPIVKMQTLPMRKDVVERRGLKEEERQGTRAVETQMQWELYQGIEGLCIDPVGRSV